MAMTKLISQILPPTERHALYSCKISIISHKSNRHSSFIPCPSIPAPSPTATIQFIPILLFLLLHNPKLLAMALNTTNPSKLNIIRPELITRHSTIFPNSSPLRHALMIPVTQRQRGRTARNIERDINRIESAIVGQ